MSTTPVPSIEAGLAAFDLLDNWTKTYLIAGADPEVLTFTGFAYEENQVVPANTPLGLNARKKLVPATVSETITYFVPAVVAIANGGTGGTPGAVTVTGTTGTGTKFQALGTISAGGVLTSIDHVSVEGNYTVAPTTPAAEPVTGGSLTGATLNITVETLEVAAAGVQAQFISTQAVTTAAGDDQTTAPVYYSGCFNVRALNWDASFLTDTDKYRAFMGAPTPTQILVKKRQGDA